MEKRNCTERIVSGFHTCMDEYFQESLLFRLHCFLFLSTRFSVLIYAMKSTLWSLPGSMRMYCSSMKRISLYLLLMERLFLFLSRAKKVVGPTRLDVIKAALRIFVQTKQRMNANHEFGLCVLTEGAIWVIIILLDNYTFDNDNSFKSLEFY